MDGVLEPIAVTVIRGLVLAGVLGAIGWHIATIGLSQGLNVKSTSLRSSP